MTRLLDAPRELVFRMWTEPDHMAQWWGPEGFTNPICEIDLRVGGSWLIVMQSSDGNRQTVQGVYREIVPPERIVFTNVAIGPDGSPVLDGVTTVTLEDLGERTRLILHTEVTAFSAEAALRLDGMEAGWSQSLGRLIDAAASRKKWEPR